MSDQPSTEALEGRPPTGTIEGRPPTEALGGRRPTVAVIIPFYNGSAWIEPAIRSVIHQTVAATEFIIVNDGSTPEERAALGRLAEPYPCTIIDKANGGQGSARNAGVAASKSEYLAFLDQDDWFLPRHIEDLLGAIPRRDPRFGWVYGDFCVADREGRIAHSTLYKEARGSHPKQGHVASLLRADLMIPPWSAMIARAAFEAVGGFDEQLVGLEDDDLYLRLFCAGYTNYFLDKPVAVWRQHDSQTSRRESLRITFRYFQKLAEAFPDNPVMNLFYFRDCLMPRFGRTFLEEAIRAAKSNSKDRQEICDILRAYRQMVCEQDSVPVYRKIRLRLAMALLTRCPAPVVRGLWALSLRMPGLRHARKGLFAQGA